MLTSRIHRIQQTLMWQQLFPDRRRERGVEALARQVADLSVEAVCRRIGGKIAGMSHYELRGYVRARAAAEITRQARAAIRRSPGADIGWEPAIVERATDRVVPMSVRHIACFGAYPPKRERLAA